MEELRMWMIHNYGAHMWHRPCNNNKRAIAMGHREMSLEALVSSTRSQRDLITDAFLWAEDTTHETNWLEIHQHWHERTINN